MDLRLPAAAGELTRAEQKILDYINTNTDTFLFSSIGQLAERLELSDATVSRFARHVGCRDFKALKSLVLEQSPGPAVKLAATLSQGARFSPQAWLERQGAEGLRLEVSGRGMAALLLDNEALGQDYGTATLEDILRDHVAPYGIELSGEASLPAVSPFSVSTGSSEWAVLYEFAQYCGGVCPRFDRAGRLVLKGWTEVENLAISDATPLTAYPK